MKQTATLIILTFIWNVPGYAQKQKLPPEGVHYLISKGVHEFPRQTGKLEIIQNHRDKYIVYKTDTSEMTVDYESIVSFLPGWNKEDKSVAIHYRLDSLVTQLFKNGLLTPDQLIRSFNTEEKYISHKGDTIYVMHHTDTKRVFIRYIRQQELNNSMKPKKGALLFEVAVIFDEKLEGFMLPSIHNFTFYLQGDFDPTASNLNDYLKTARIKQLKYRGTQI